MLLHYAAYFGGVLPRAQMYVKLRLHGRVAMNDTVSPIRLSMSMAVESALVRNRNTNVCQRTGKRVQTDGSNLVIWFSHVVRNVIG
jgi:hypothetical protein